MQEHVDRVTGQNTAYLDPKVGPRLLDTAFRSLHLALLTGERVLGLFAVTRFRRSVSLLVVTDQRLLTLGDQHVGMPVVDQVRRADVVRLHVERDKVLTTGLVTATTDQGEVNLGTLTYGPETFLRLDEVLARTDAPMPVIPTPASPHPGEAPGGLVAQLTALVELHERGGLTAAEFRAAKARLLADPSA